MLSSLNVRWLASAALLFALFAPHQALYADTRPKRLDPGQAPESLLWVGNTIWQS